MPTLVLADRVLDQSRDIACHALGASEATLDGETKAWLDLHYGYPIEELTFGGILARSPLARIMIPKQLAATERKLLERARRHPELADIYKERAAVFAHRVSTFDPAAVVQLSQVRRAEAQGYMDRFETLFGDGRATLAPSAYGVGDVVLTVFLARMEFAGLGAELGRRPALVRYWRAMQARPSFATADIWTKRKHTRKAAEECSERGGQATRSIWSLMISRRFWRPNSVKAMVSRPPTSWIQSIPSSGSS